MRWLLIAIALLVSGPSSASRIFNGTTDLANCEGITGALDIATNGDMAMFAWVNFNNFTGTQTFVSKGFNAAAGTTAYQFQLTSGPSALTWGSFSSGSVHGVTVTMSALNWSPAEWHAVYGDYDSGTTTWHLYVDSKLAGSTVSAVGPVSVARRFAIGAINTNASTIFQQFANAQIAEVAVFSGPLTAGEIAALGTQQIFPNKVTSKTILGYWPLINGFSPEQDLSGNANTCALTGTQAGGFPFKSQMMGH